MTTRQAEERQEWIAQLLGDKEDQREGRDGETMVGEKRSPYSPPSSVVAPDAGN